jgi:hypothetical protein
MNDYSTLSEPLRSICDGSRPMSDEKRSAFRAECDRRLGLSQYAVEHHGPDAPRVSRTLTPAAPAAPMLGDAISSALSAIGITEERVSAWLGKPCGCGARKKKLNDLHAWFAGDRATAPVVE